MDLSNITVIGGIIVSSLILWGSWVTRSVLKITKESRMLAVEKLSLLNSQKLDDIMDFWQIPQREKYKHTE